MFWKKKRPKTNLILHTPDEHRNAFRYHFKDGRGLIIRFMGKEICVLNISARGLAFKNNGFQPHDADFICFTLDIPKFRKAVSFSIGLKILTIDADSICHSVFEQCSLEQQELLHKYVLEMQKNDLAH